MSKRGDNPKPLDLSGRIKRVFRKLNPIKPKRVKVVPKPPMPDVSVGFFRKVWLIVEKAVDATARGTGIDLGKVVSLPSTLVKLGFIVVIALIAGGILLFALKSC